MTGVKLACRNPHALVVAGISHSSSACRDVRSWLIAATVGASGGALVVAHAQENAWIAALRISLEATATMLVLIQDT